MRRRSFIAIVGAAALARPRAGRAQQPKVPRIGVLIVGNPEPFWRLFRNSLRELGYVEGRRVLFEFRSADGKPNLLAGLAADLVRLKVDIIVAVQTPAVAAAKHATATIPIVMASAGDPVGTGLIASLARPGGNLTGMAGVTAELAGKNLELIRELLPAARRVGVLANPADPFTTPFLAQIQLTARMLGIEIQTIMIGGVDEFDAAFMAMKRERVAAAIVQPSLPRKRAIDLALSHRLPAASPVRPFAEDGGLLAYAQDVADQYRKAAVYVDKILKGAKPADLPVEQPTKFELVINLKTAKALGIAVPTSILVRATEVIE